MRSLAIGGFMAVGKTTVGRRVAERLGLPFFDLDAEVEASAGQPVAAIFAAEGEPGFRARERAALAALCERGPMVLALGGGALHAEGTRELLDERWQIVVLDAPFAELERRLGDRPLAPQARELYQRRAPGYEAAGTLIPVAGRSPDELAVALCDLHRAAA